MRDSALRPSTVLWARSIAFVTIFASMGWSSGRARSITQLTAPVANSRISSSSSDRKNLDSPGSPWRPERPAQLVVDAAGLVALRAEHVEAARLAHRLRRPSSQTAARRALASATPPPRRPTPGLDALAAQLPGGQALGVAAEHDVDATAGHVGRHGDRAGTARLGDDLGLSEVLLCVQDLVGHAALVEQAREVLGLGDRGGAHEDRLALSRRSTMSSTTASNFASSVL